MQHLTHSEAGHAHLNEDCVEARVHPLDRSVLVAVLADGQGGQFGGGAASRAAVKRCLDWALSQSVEELLTGATWREVFHRVDEAVERDGDAGFTTLIGLCVTPTQICGASCGDSAALVVAGGSHLELTAAQRKNPPLGSGGAAPVAFAGTRPAGSTVLLVSNGVWKFVGFEAIAAVASAQSGPDLVMALRELPLKGNGGKLPDDFSVVAVW